MITFWLRVHISHWPTQNMVKLVPTFTGRLPHQNNPICIKYWFLKVTLPCWQYFTTSKSMNKCLHMGMGAHFLSMYCLFKITHQYGWKAATGHRGHWCLKELISQIKNKPWFHSFFHTQGFSYLNNIGKPYSVQHPSSSNHLQIWWNA